MKYVTVKYTLYEYKELSQAAQKKAHQKFNEENEFDDLLYCQIMEWLEYLLKKNNIKSLNHELHYSLTYSQGDGACFTGIFEWRNFTITIHRNSFIYSHSKSVDFIFETDFNDTTSGLNIELIKNDFIIIYEDICKDLEGNGYETIDWENSEENFIETCNLNNYMFHKNGELFDETK